MNLRSDPTRTALIRRQFMGEVLRRMRLLKVAVISLIVDEDAFGLTEAKPLRFNVRALVRNEGRYAFLTTDKKVSAFADWLETQINAKVLALGPGQTPFTAKYVSSAYRKGALRAYMDVNRKKLSKKPDFYLESQSQFLRDAFSQPETLSKVRLLATRAFENMKGVTAMQKAQMNRIFADAMAHGRGPKAIARDLVERIDGLTRTRALMVARTEVIHAHAEGQLDSFEELGVGELGVEAEWSTAGDDNVCPRCSSAAAAGPYKIADARGMIPLHPNCRCSWVPFVPVEPKKKKRRK